MFALLIKGKHYLSTVYDVVAEVYVCRILYKISFEYTFGLPTIHRADTHSKVYTAHEAKSILRVIADPYGISYIYLASDTA